MKFSKGEVICREDLGCPEGALVCDGYDDAGRVLAHPLAYATRVRMNLQQPSINLICLPG